MVTGVQDVVANVIEGRRVLKIGVRGIASKTTFSQAEVGPEDQAGIVQFAGGAGCGAFLRTEHPELKPIRLPIWFIEAVLPTSTVQLWGGCPS